MNIINIPKDFTEYDILTLSKSLDASRLFLRGQFALHQNNDKLNSLWNKLSYLQPVSFARRIGDAAHMLSVNKYALSEEVFSKYFLN